MGKMKEIYNMIENGDYKKFKLSYESAISKQETKFYFHNKIYSVLEAANILLILENTK
mgnify:CR=1 FL=1